VRKDGPPVPFAGVKAAIEDFFSPPGAEPQGDIEDAVKDENVQRGAIGTFYAIASNARYLAPAADVAADAIPVIGQVVLAYQVGKSLYEGGKAYKESVDECYGQ
jgi:hypothetical protein